MSHLHITCDRWNKKHAELLEAACTEDFPLSELKTEVYLEYCSVFKVANEAQEHIASFVVRLEPQELVVVAAGGYLAHGSLYKLITPYVEKLAASHDKKYIRGHASRAGVGRLMLNAGWEQSEIVYRKAVSNGRA